MRDIPDIQANLGKNAQYSEKKLTKKEVAFL
jgi:hypothetical protein